MKAQFQLPLGQLYKMVFLERPNRFLVRCESDQLGRIEAFLPNPGRLCELLLPGASLYVAPTTPLEDERSVNRKTRYTAVAVERSVDFPREGERPVVLLHTHLTNEVARFLIEQGRIPGLEKAQIVQREVRVGRNRFDFLLRERGRNLYLEVKSCTLFGNGVAMFPDAVTERGTRHIHELGKLAQAGCRTSILFLVHTTRVRWFMPDFYTDPAFAQTLLAVGGPRVPAYRRVRVIPVAVEWQWAPEKGGRTGATLTLGNEAKTLVVPWVHVTSEAQNRGAYLLVVHLNEGRTIEVGTLGSRAFPKGFYVYVGSAMQNLAARVERHLRARKSLRWHVDYLCAEADRILPLPIRSSVRLECEMARTLAKVLRPATPGFGSSDCRCKTHLFYSKANPLEIPSFHVVLQRFRMRPPNETRGKRKSNFSVFSVPLW